MSHDDLTMLLAQLDECLAEGSDHPIEAAALAGLIARISADHPALGRVSRLAAATVGERLADAASDLREAVEGCDEDTEAEVSWDRLVALDELSAAANWLHQAARLRGPVQDAAATISAFPEAWAVHAPAASVLLQRQPPLPDDPAWALWRAVESAALGVDDEGEDAPGTPSSVRIAAGLDVVIDLAVFRTALRRAAAGQLPEPPPWVDLRSADDWSAGLTAEGGAMWLVLEAPTGADGQPAVSVQHNGADVVLDRHAAVWRCEARAGHWTLEGLGAQLAFSLGDVP